MCLSLNMMCVSEINLVSSLAMSVCRMLDAVLLSHKIVSMVEGRGGHDVLWSGVEIMSQ